MVLNVSKIPFWIKQTKTVLQSQENMTENWVFGFYFFFQFDKTTVVEILKNIIELMKRFVIIDFCARTGYTDFSKQKTK